MKIEISIEDKEVSLSINGKKVTKLDGIYLDFCKYCDGTNYIDFNYRTVKKSKDGFVERNRFDYDPSTASIKEAEKENIYEGM